MAEQECPVCKSTTYRNPSLKLLVNVCGHTLCETCVDLLFLKGSGSCPECSIPLRRNNFRVQLFENPLVQKELTIRRRLLKDYNKEEQDFDTLDEYNDYLEEIESLVFNLCNNIDIIETNKRIEAYKRENRDIIQRNRLRKGRQYSELDEIIEIERKQEEERRKELEHYENESRLLKLREKEALLNRLMEGDKDAHEIVNEFAQKAEKIREEEKKLPPSKVATQLSNSVQYGANSHNTFLPLPREEEGELYEYKPPTITIEGPTPPTKQEIETKGFLTHIRPETLTERAGGFRSTLACQRALQEAMQGLFHGIA